MAKKQKTKDKPNPEDVSVKPEEINDGEENQEDVLDSSDEVIEETKKDEDRIQELEEALLRSRAELDNAIKRNTADIEKAHKYGVERLLNELLPVVDNLEHALNNFSKD